MKASKLCQILIIMLVLHDFHFQIQSGSVDKVTSFKKGYPLDLNIYIRSKININSNIDININSNLNGNGSERVRSVEKKGIQYPLTLAFFLILEQKPVRTLHCDLMAMPRL